MDYIETITEARYDAEERFNETLERYGLDNLSKKELIIALYNYDIIDRDYITEFGTAEGGFEEKGLDRFSLSQLISFCINYIPMDILDNLLSDLVEKLELRECE